MDPLQRGGDDWPPLTDDDRRGIEAIRRELDRDLGPPDDAPEALEAGARPRPAARSAIAPPREPWIAAVEPETPIAPSRSRGITIVAVVLAAIVGGVAGSALTAVLLLPSRAPESPASLSPPAPAAAGGEARSPAPDAAAVSAALEAWLEATRHGDIRAQMAFYPPVVPVYYTWRDAPSASVEAEKRKVFGDAVVLDIRAGPPQIEVDTAQGVAVTRFRKAYVIEGPRVQRRGEVLQELRWTRIRGDWKITAERDAALLSGG